MEKLYAREYCMVGIGLAEHVLDDLWGEVKSLVNYGFPYLDVLLAGYKTGKFISNTLFKTDSTIEQYCVMLATIDVENLAYDVYKKLEESYRSRKDIDSAAAYLSAIDVLFSSRDQDCVNAYKFVDVLDNAAANQIGALFEQTGANQRDNIKTAVSKIQRNYTSVHESTVLTSWINYLEEDYPNSGLYEKYNHLFAESARRILRKKYVVACPVDIHVYDKDGNLVAYVVDNKPYCSNDITIAVKDDIKTLYFYGTNEYQVKCTGNDRGTMDLAITEYNQNETVLRDVYFYDIPLTDGRQYEVDIDGRTLGDVTYQLTGQDAGVTVPDLDTYQPDRVKHTVRIVSGSMVKQDELLFETDAYPDEQIDIYAYIPENAEFIGWTSDVGIGIFEDTKSPATKVRVPNSDVTLTAVIKNTAPDTGQSGDLNGDGKVTMAGVIRLARGAAGYVVLTEQEQKAGDVTGDGKITMADAIRVARYAAGYSTSL